MSKSLSNIKIKKEENLCLVSVNPKLYQLDVIYSAAYVFIDRAYVLLDGDVKKKVIVELKPKEGCSLEKLGMEFNNELLNYAQYKKQAKLNAPIRKALIQRALLTNDPSLLKEDDDPDLKEIEKDLDYLKDPKGISIPWEKKHSKKKKPKPKKSRKKK